jgi:CheY-like chemotaxis protein
MTKALNILFRRRLEIMKFNRVLSTLKLKHKIVEADNGEEAILKGEIVPDIIVLDFNMPKINGIEFLEF